MNPENLNRLKEKYPILFENVYCGVSCEDGWVSLIDELSSKVTALMTKYNCEIKYDQIKEKFGLLRIYFNCSDGTPAEVSNHVDSLVSGAEELSGTICEVCGEPGKLSGKYWVKTVCSKHTT